MDAAEADAYDRAYQMRRLMVVLKALSAGSGVDYEELTTHYRTGTPHTEIRLRIDSKRLDDGFRADYPDGARSPIRWK